MHNGTPVTDNVLIKPANLRRQTDEYSSGIKNILTGPTTYTIAMICNIIAIILIPFAFFILIPLGLLYFLYLARQQFRLPYRMPLDHGHFDYSAPLPGQLGTPKKFRKGTGILYIGSCVNTGRQLFLSDDDARRHGFCLGTTGSGKALPMSALVLTAHRGWVANKDISVGDVLMHPRGGTSQVTDVFKQSQKQRGGRIFFEDGRYVDCSNDHLWSVIVQCKSRNPVFESHDAEEKLMTASDIAILHETSGDRKNIYIPLSQALELGGSVPQDLDLPDLESRGFHCLKTDLSIVGSPTERRKILIDFLKIRDRHISIETHEMGVRVKCHSEDEALSLQKVFWSLGGTAVVIEARDKTWYLAGFVYGFQDIWCVDPNVLQNINDLGLRVVRVDPLKDAQEMQCIKIDRPDGLFITDNFIVTHNTELLLGIISQPLMWSSGFLFVDGKGTQEFYNRVWSVARRFGREDDLRVVNFTSAGSDPDAPAGGFSSQSNTMNPFSKGSADQLINLMASLMPQSQGQDMWKNRAITLVGSVMRTLVEMRDAGDILLDVQTIRDFLPLGVGVKPMSSEPEPRTPMERQRALKNGYKDVSEIKPEEWEDLKNRPGLIELYLRALNNEFSEQTRLSLTAFFETLPNFSLDKALRGADQESKAIEQLGYLTMQLTGPLGMLADSYSHIFKTPMGEIDIFDVVLNRRILIALLPALQKDDEEVQNCGKIIISMIKLMMGASGNSRLQGLTKELVDASPTKSISPFIIVLDEAGYYLVNGVDVILAQARSYGVMAIVAGQDISAMQKVSAQLAETAAANARVTMVGATEDASKTLEFISKKFGKRMTAVSNGMDKVSGLFSTKYYDHIAVSYQEQDIVRAEQLQALEAGKFYFIFEGQVVLANTPHIDTKRDSEANVNRFLKVRGPTDEVPDRDQSYEKALINSFIEQASCMIDADGAISRAKTAFGMADGVFGKMEDKLGIGTRFMPKLSPKIPMLIASTGVLMALSRVPDLERSLSEDSLDELDALSDELDATRTPPPVAFGLDTMSDEEVYKNANLQMPGSQSETQKKNDKINGKTTAQSSVSKSAQNTKRTAAELKGESLRASIFGEKPEERLQAMSSVMSSFPDITKKMNATVTEKNGKLSGILEKIDLDGQHAFRPLTKKTPSELENKMKELENLVKAT